MRKQWGVLSRTAVAMAVKLWCARRLTLQERSGIVGLDWAGRCSVHQSRCNEKEKRVETTKRHFGPHERE